MLNKRRNRSRFGWLRLVGCLAITAPFFREVLPVNAQLIPDNTLGAENSRVTPQGIRDLIEGGAIRGSNLFHSFAEFNIGSQQQVYFANPSGIANILTRVTGNNVSNIFGTLGVEGSANLFLINPKGIIFGGDARLDVSGSFVASTADGIRWGEEGFFSAKEPETSRLLTIQPGVLFHHALRSQQAEIRNQGNLMVGAGQTLTLHAYSVTSTGSLTAPKGTVEVLGERVSLLDNGSVDVSSPIGGGTVVIGQGEQIEIGAGVRINADATSANSNGNGNGGSVIVKSDGTTNFQGDISARGGENSGNGGFVEVSGANLQFSGTVNTSASNGKVGTLLLDPKDILIQAGSPISGLAISQALFLNDVILQADNDITVDDDITGIGTNNLTLLVGRSLTLAPNRSILLNGGNFTAKFNDENALIPADRDPGIAGFVMSPGSQILTNGGNVTIASGTFEQTSQINTANAGIITSNSAGNSGNISLFSLGDTTTGLLDTRSATGNGGNVSVTSAGGAITTTNTILSDSLFRAGDISLQAAGNLSVTGGGIHARGATPGKLTITSGGVFSAQGVAINNTNLGAGTPNDVTVTARSIEIENSGVGTAVLGVGQGGNVLVQADDEVVMRNGQIGSITLSSGNAGNLTLNTRRLTIIKEPGATIPSRFLTQFLGVGTIGAAGSTGNGGDLTINASESIEVIGDKPGAFALDPTQVTATLFQSDTGIATSAFGSGNSGNLTINTGRLVVRDGVGITTFPAVGEGGNLTVSANEIFLQGEAGLGTSTLGFGDAGDLSVKANNVIVTDGAAIAAPTFSSGNAGAFELTVGSLSVRNGSVIGSTTIAPGNGGSVTVKASDLVEVVGTSADGRFASGIVTNAVIPQSGNAGTIDIETDRLVIRQGGEVSTATVSAGQGGDIQIRTRTLQLDNGKINASTLGIGNAGNINIDARSIFLDNGSITATSISGEGRNIQLDVADNLILRNNSQISTRAGTQPSDRGNGGNIDINARFIVAVLEENSDITANANAGNGGNINITAQGIYGLQVTDEPTLTTSDITASSQLGIDGMVEINTPDVDPSKGLTQFPSALSDPSNQIVAGCPADQGNSFTVTGRGGIPDNPTQYLRGRAVWQDTRDRTAQPLPYNEQSTTNHQTLIEAQGWIVDKDGTVTLTAEPFRREFPPISSHSCEHISESIKVGDGS